MLLLLPHHLILEFVLQPLSDLFSDAVHVTAVGRVSDGSTHGCTHGCSACGHLWVAASGIGRLVAIAPTREARKGSRATGGKTV
jgi:hypothetical protein